MTRSLDKDDAGGDGIPTLRQLEFSVLPFMALYVVDGTGTVYLLNETSAKGKE